MLRDICRYVQGTYHIFLFYSRYLSVLHEIHDCLPTLAGMETLQAANLSNAPVSWSRKIDSEKVKAYNAALQELKNKLRSITGAGPDFSSFVLPTVVLIRCAAIAACLLVGWRTALLVSCLQFIVAPYSFAVATLHIFTNLVELVMHYTIHATVLWIAAASNLSSPHAMPFTPGFAMLFLALDQLLNLAVYLKYNVRLPFTALLKHVIYGFLNTKTVTALLLLALCDSPRKLDLSVWVMTGILTWYAGPWLQSRFYRLSGLPSFSVLFYHQHRIAHLPGVYPCAHKFHHFYAETTAFDAHIYGSGLPEEFWWIVVEVLLWNQFGFMPYTLNARVLYDTLCNKFGHTRFKDGHGINHHADHHKYSNVNYGSEFGIPFEMVMLTNSDNSSYDIKVHGCDVVQAHGFRVPAARLQRTEDAKTITLSCHSLTLVPRSS